MLSKKLKMGMVGGGEGAFIGSVHRLAAAMDGEIELVCGAFSHDAERSKRSGQALHLATQRCYASYADMFARESAMPAEQRMDFVAIVTPNHLHFPVAMMALEHGFHVISDKPATLNLAEANTLAVALNNANCLYGLTHVYTGYPMVKEAKALIAAGELGNIRKVVAEYTQGWLAFPPEPDNKQAAWRLDPAQSGSSCCMGDIGVHAANLAEYLCGEISHVCADLNTVVPGRQLDDDGTVLLKFANGAKGVLLASQICIGDENNLGIRVYGDKASLSWSQLEPNTLWLKYPDQATQMRRTGVGTLSQTSRLNTRTPAGHPEGYLEAFANIYRNFAAHILAKQSGIVADKNLDVPGIDAALRGMAFIESVLAASRSEQKWLPVITA